MGVFLAIVPLFCLVYACASMMVVQLGVEKVGEIVRVTVQLVIVCGLCSPEQSQWREPPPVGLPSALHTISAPPCGPLMSLSELMQAIKLLKALTGLV